MPARTGSPLHTSTRNRAASSLWSVRLDGWGALYEQVVRALKRAILDGPLKPGTRMPAVRALAKQLGVSRNTIATAYEILRVDQWVVAYERSGTRVAEIRKRSDTAESVPTPAQSRYALRLRQLSTVAPGKTREPQPYDRQLQEPAHGQDFSRSWRRRLLATARMRGSCHPDSMGFQPLRLVIAEYLTRWRGVACNEQDILIVNGKRQAMTLILGALLNEDDPVVIEEPHSQCLMQALTACGARVIGIPTDENGIMTSELHRYHARLVCVTPSHLFPSGAVLSPARRLKLLDHASTRCSWILEDDYDCELQCGVPALAALRSLDSGARVIYAGSFSKALFPYAQLGFVLAPHGLYEDLLRAKRMDGLDGPTIEQVALASFMRSRQFDRYLHDYALDLERRRSTLVEGLRRSARGRIEIVDPRAGGHVVVWLRAVSYARLNCLIRLAQDRGLGLHPIHPYYRLLPPRPGLLFGYAGLSVQQLSQAPRLFGKCLDALNEAATPHRQRFAIESQGVSR